MVDRRRDSVIRIDFQKLRKAIEVMADFVVAVVVVV